MTALELAGFKSTGALPATTYLNEFGSIARKRKGPLVDVILSIGDQYHWTQIEHDDILNMVPDYQRASFLDSTNCASFHEWARLSVTEQVYDLIYFYDKRIFTDNKPNRKFETLKEVLNFLEKVS